jgi:HlyD family secretion protein
LKKLLLLLLVAAAAVVGWGVFRKSTPPSVNFTRAKKQTLVSTLPTNGKVEPFEWQAVRAQTAGIVSRVPVHEGQSVAAGAVLAQITDPSLASELEAAQARVAEARANLSALEAGGKPAELAEIANSLERARLQLKQQENDYSTLQRLLEKQAATGMDVQAARDKLQQTRITIDGLEARRKSLVAQTDLAAQKARLQDAEAALNLARRRAAESVVRAPLSGVVYDLAARPGAYLDVGDLVTNVGAVGKLRVRVYVDEPELGRVAQGQPVTITWQALPGKQWHGTVESMPTSIETLGSRQVGQIVCTIDNPGRELIPGTNIDALIRTAAVENALIIPKEALRHDASGDYVYTLKDAAISRCPVKTGISSVTRIQITEGLADGDPVALPSDLPLKNGDRVTAVL